MHSTIVLRRHATEVALCYEQRSLQRKQGTPASLGDIKSGYIMDQQLLITIGILLKGMQPLRPGMALSLLLIFHLTGMAVGLPSALLERTSLSLAERSEANTLAPPTIGVYFCIDANWLQCQKLVNPTAICINLEPPLAGNVSAVGPDAPASGCTFFQQAGCKGEHLANLKEPGEPNLAVNPEGGRYNDFFNSYICY